MKLFRENFFLFILIVMGIIIFAGCTTEALKGSTQQDKFKRCVNSCSVDSAYEYLDTIHRDSCTDSGWVKWSNTEYKVRCPGGTLVGQENTKNSAEDLCLSACDCDSAEQCSYQGVEVRDSMWDCIDWVEVIDYIDTVTDSTPVKNCVGIQHCRNIHDSERRTVRWKDDCDSCDLGCKSGGQAKILIDSPECEGYADCFCEEVPLGCIADPNDIDNDGVADSIENDTCVGTEDWQKEDHDGFQDEDGCQDYDNDGDLIPDSLDNCDTTHCQGILCSLETIDSDYYGCADSGTIDKDSIDISFSIEAKSLASDIEANAQFLVFQGTEYPDTYRTIQLYTVGDPTPNTLTTNFMNWLVIDNTTNDTVLNEDALYTEVVDLYIDLDGQTITYPRKITYSIYATIKLDSSSIGKNNLQTFTIQQTSDDSCVQASIDAGDNPVKTYADCEIEMNKEGIYSIDFVNEQQFTLWKTNDDSWENDNYGDMGNKEIRYPEWKDEELDGVPESYEPICLIKKTVPKFNLGLYVNIKKLVNGRVFLRALSDGVQIFKYDTTITNGYLEIKDADWLVSIQDSLGIREFTLNWELSTDSITFNSIGESMHKFFIIYDTPIEFSSGSMPLFLTCKRLNGILMQCENLNNSGQIASSIQNWLDKYGFLSNIAGIDGYDAEEHWALLDLVGQGQCAEAGLLMEQCLRVIGLNAEYQHVLPAIDTTYFPVHTISSPVDNLKRVYEGKDEYLWMHFSGGTLNGWNEGEGSCSLGDTLYSMFAFGSKGVKDEVVSTKTALSAAHCILLKLSDGYPQLQRWYDPVAKQGNVNGDWEPVP